MITVYKYAVGTVVYMPIGARPLRVGLQSGRMFIWAVVDTDRPVEPRVFEAYGTGHAISPKDAERYVSTVFDDPYVWHVFETDLPRDLSRTK